MNPSRREAKPAGKILIDASPLLAYAPLKA
jgi:hypothetical protein